MAKERVVCAMSGGVDSSVAAGILKEQGYDVIGITLQLWPHSLPIKEVEGGCCSLSAVEDARRVADRLGIPYYVLNYQEVFTREVIDKFAAEYQLGRTPNPCIRCNEQVKFGALMLNALELDADYVATGHYARLGFDESRGRYVVRRAADTWKDQTYTMYGLSQKQLSHMMFPLGDLTKEETRELATKWGLITAKKPESMEICFIPDNDYRGFLEKYAPGVNRSGPIMDIKGNILGEHKGISFYTVGQRKRLGIAAGEAIYVVAIDVEKNAVIVGTKDEVLGLTAVASHVNLQAVSSLDASMRVTAKIRYGVREVPAWIEPLDDGRVMTRFDEPQRAITPGQSIVWYDGDVVVGGGLIDKSTFDATKSTAEEKVEIAAPLIRA